MARISLLFCTLTVLASAADRLVSREDYRDGLQGFWMAQCIANWTGLITEMDRVEAPFYTDADWGQPDQPNMWGGEGHHPVIEFFVVREGDVWGADDDTDLEYLYQYLHETNRTSKLTAEQIREGWLEHLWSDNFNQDGQNYLWVSNENAYELMVKGHLPPATSDPKLNPDFDMIDAQLTTEIFGLFAPGDPDVALEIARLPIMTTARENARAAAEFYVIMHALAADVDRDLPLRDQLFAMAAAARARTAGDSVIADMYDFVKLRYDANPDTDDWAATRDALYEEYQIGGRAGYVYAKPFDAAINFGASMVSLFYGEGDLQRTIQIGSLAGWDSDNPTATWAGLLGFMLGRSGVEEVFGDDISETYWISRTRRNFPDRTPDLEGEDTFPQMANRALFIIDRVVRERMSGNANRIAWVIPIDHE
ncbi:MAG: hypothetical protein SynsKO_04310 [Synoicihabitans sp.]